MVHLVLDHARLEAGGLQQRGSPSWSSAADAHVHRALDVDGDSREAEAALVGDLLVAGDPLDLGVRERDGRRVGAGLVDEQRREMPSWGAARPTPIASPMIAAIRARVTRVSSNRVTSDARERRAGSPNGPDLGERRGAPRARSSLSSSRSGVCAVLDVASVASVISSLTPHS